MTHLCASALTIIRSDNGLSPGRRQAIIWTNARILLIGPLGINFSEILIEIHTFSLKKMYLKMSSAKGRKFRLGLDVLRFVQLICHARDHEQNQINNIEHRFNKVISVPCRNDETLAQCPHIAIKPVVFWNALQEFLWRYKIFIVSTRAFTNNCYIVSQKSMMATGRFYSAVPLGLPCATVLS